MLYTAATAATLAVADVCAAGGVYAAASDSEAVAAPMLLPLLPLPLLLLR
jgi:hypothetical protein